MSQAIDDLRHEHEAIRFALNILVSLMQRLQAGAEVPVSDLAAFIGFLKEFADKCHHGKEEGLLFPALEAAGVARAGGPIGMLLTEHEQGRHWIAEMAASLQPAHGAAATETPHVATAMAPAAPRVAPTAAAPAAAPDTSPDAARFSAAAHGYATLLDAHIDKENNVLFPMAERVLGSAQLEALYVAFEAHEEQVIGAGRHEQLHALLKDLHRKYVTAS